MAEGLRSVAGDPSASPYSNGPYIWDQAIEFSGAITFSNDVTFTGDIDFGDAITDSLTCNGIFNMGTNGTPLVLTAGTPLFSLYTTNAGTSGSTSAEPFYVKSVLTGVGQVGGRARFHAYSNVASGGWINALKAYMEFGSSGSSSGLASAFCAEMTMPNQTVPGGQYYPIEVEMIAGANTGTAGTLGSGCGFIYMNITGTKTDFDDEAGVMWVNGVTAGAGHVLSANDNTLRIFVTSSMTAKYMVLSDAEDCISMDSCATAITIGNSVTTGISIGTASTAAIALTGTYANGIDLTAATLTQAIDNNLFSIGSYSAAKSVTLTDNYIPFQINLESIADAGKIMGAMYIKVAATTATHASAQLIPILIRGNIQQNISSFYGIQNHITIDTNAVTIGEEVMGMSTQVTGTTAVTGMIYGGLFSMVGAGIEAGTSHCLKLDTRTSAEVKSALYIENCSGTTMTNLIYVNNAGTNTNFIKFEGETDCVSAEANSTFSGDGVKLAIAVGADTYYLRACKSFS